MRAVAALLCVALLAGSAHADDDRLSGAAKVRGPDTLVLAGTRIRLSGVQPPADESQCGNEACADVAATALGELTAGGPVTCVKERRLGHGYFLGHCQTAADADPALTMLQRGLLQLDPATAPDNYVRAAEAARSARVGLWGG